MPGPQLTAHLRHHREAVARRLRNWRHQDMSEALLAADGSLWSVHQPPELVNRLGWLDLPLRPASEVEQMVAFGEEVRAAGLDHFVLLGMGGSSLAAEMFSASLAAPGAGRLEVLDTTHPAEVSSAARRWDPQRTLFIVASKSGRTLETLSLYRYFRQWLSEAGRDPGQQLVAITDPDSELADEAEKAGFRRLWLANPEVGGRYSALTEFGMVPAALCGVDIGAVTASARTARDLLQGSVEECMELAQLGAILGELAAAGTDKLTLVTGRGMVSFPAWVEQLVAESLGKRGRGIVPVVGEPLASAKAYDADRLFVALELAGEANAALEEALDDLAVRHPVVRIELQHITDIGFELFRWEVATALAASILGVHPFDQPDVEAAKDLSKQAMEGNLPPADSRDGLWLADLGPASEEETLVPTLRAWLRGVQSGGYIGVQAYLPRSPELDTAVRSLRAELGQLTRLATTFGYGPRFLHSTGQLHKGGPNCGLFIQLVDSAGPELAALENGFEFGAMIRAQAQGDAEALYQRGQWVLQIHVGDDAVTAVERLASWFAAERRGSSG